MKYEKQYKEGFELGVKLASAAHGVSRGEATRTTAKVDTLLANAAVQNMLCKTAAIVLQLGGEADSLECKLFTKMASYDAPFHKHTVDAYIVPVLQAFAHYGREMRDTELAKAAGVGMGLGSVFSSGKKVLAGTMSALASLPAVYKLILLSSAIGGGGIGGLGWMLNRDATSNALEAEAMEQQALHYRNIAKDIQKRMNLEESKDLREAAKVESNANYVL